MQKEKLERLKEVLHIQSKSKKEDRMIEYLTNVLTEKGYDFFLDKYKNIYVTKGQSDYYPCFVAHTDTVHDINDNMIVHEDYYKGKLILTGIDSVTGKPSGIGGDDKCGVFLCLEMLDTLDVVKAAFFVSEEIGCIGSQHADKKFFSNVGYAIQYDSPGGDSMSYTLLGSPLFDENTEFGEKAGKLIIEHGIVEWERHPYTDVWQLTEQFDFSCLNLAAGYYNYHTKTEYVIVDDVQNSFNLGLKLINELGYVKHERKKSLPKIYSKVEPKLITEYYERLEESINQMGLNFDDYEMLD